MRDDIFILNKKLKKQFEIDRTEGNLRQYVMSELMSPIEDFPHVIDLVISNIDIIQDLRLIFIAAYLYTGWKAGGNKILAYLHSKVESMTDCEKAIYWYLNAYDLERKKDANNDLCREYLRKSIFFSTNVNFANNRYELSMLETGARARALMNDARVNVIEVISSHDVERPIEYWLDIQKWIDEFILGIRITEAVYELHYMKQS